MKNNINPVFCNILTVFEFKNFLLDIFLLKIRSQIKIVKTKQHTTNSIFNIATRIMTNAKPIPYSRCNNSNKYNFKYIMVNNPPQVNPLRARALNQNLFLNLSKNPSKFRIREYYTKLTILSNKKGDQNL